MHSFIINMEEEEEDTGSEKVSVDEAIIPGLPDEVSEQCLLRIPYPYQSPVRAVSSTWNRIIKDPTFVVSKNRLSLSIPYIFVMAFHKDTATLQWQALDPRSGCWFVLPPMPASTSITPSSLACASLQHLGQLFVLGGNRQQSPEDRTTPSSIVTTYHVSSNRWFVGSAPMPTPRAFFTAESVGGKIVVMGGDELPSPSSVECYDPSTDSWTVCAGMSEGLAKYDSAVMGNCVYVTEGWTWPFMWVPRGCVYDLETDAWREMSEGMRDGWTGFSLVMGQQLFVMSEHGDHRLKVYVPECDSWRYVEGDKFPCQALQKPFAVTSCCSDEGMMIYVMSSGLNVGVGRVMDEGGRGLSVEWRVLAAPTDFRNLSPCNAHLLYA